MGQLSRKPNHILVNTATEFPLSLFANDYTAATAAAATQFRVDKYSPIIPLTRIHSVRGVRGAEGTRHQLQLVTGNTTINGPIPANTLVEVNINIISSNYEAEYNRVGGLDGAEATYQIELQPTDTFDTVLAKIYNSIYQDQRLSFKNLVTVLTPAEITVGGFGTFNADGFAATITQLDIFSANPSIEIRDFKIVGSDERPSTFITINPTVVTEQYEGANNYQVLKNLFTPDVREIRTRETNMIPVEGALYTMLSWEVFTYRDDLGGGTALNQQVTTSDVYTMYINEANVTLVNDLAEFLSRATILSTANPAMYDAPVFLSETNPPVAEALAAFQI